MSKKQALLRLVSQYSYVLSATVSAVLWTRNSESLER